VTTRLVLKDELLDAQLLRAVDTAPAGGAEVGECIATARRISGTDLDSWYTEWTATADAVFAEAEAAGNVVAARHTFFRACTYYRTAGGMLLGAPLEPRLVEANQRQTDAFRRDPAALFPRRGCREDHLPTFVCNAEGDDISARAPQLADALVCPKEFVTFTNAEGAGDHYEAGNRAIYHARSFDWLDRVLGSAG
jgi:hypothetical protein